MKRPPHLVLSISSWVSVAREYAEKSTVKCKHAIEGNWMTARFDTAEGSKVVSRFSITRWTAGAEAVPSQRIAREKVGFATSGFYRESGCLPCPAVRVR